MEKTDEKLASLIEKLQDAGFTQAPEVFDGAVRAIYWDGVVQLGAAAVAAGLFLLSLALVLLGCLKDSEATAAVGALMFLLMAAITSAAENPWLKVFDPEAAFYQQVLKGLLG